MKRTLTVAGGILAGAVAVWLLALSFGLFLLGVVIGLLVRLAIVTNQRDEVTVDLAEAWFDLAAYEQQLQRVAPGLRFAGRIPTQRDGSGS